MVLRRPGMGKLSPVKIADASDRAVDWLPRIAIAYLISPAPFCYGQYTTQIPISNNPQIYSLVAHRRYPTRAQRLPPEIQIRPA